jgi:uncharacterized protein YyaL (SSP411 family)
MAEKASDFIYKDMFQKGRLLASFRQGPSEIQGYIDDYAFLQEAQLDLYESTYEPKYLQRALDLDKEMIRLFWDEKKKGYFFTGSDQKDAHRLLTRTKEAYDGVIPSGNSVAALNDYRLAEFTGDKVYRDRADAILTSFSGLLARGGSNFCKMIQAFQFDFYGPAEVLVLGDHGDSSSVLESLWRDFLPGKVLVFTTEKDLPALSKLVPWIQGRVLKDGKPTVYVCRNYQCQLPVNDPGEALELLK